MNPIKLLAETIIAGGALIYPPLALAQPLLSQILDKAPNSESLKNILKILIDNGADVSSPKEALSTHKAEIENEVRSYLNEVLDQIRTPTGKITIQNAGINDIFESILAANSIGVHTHSGGKTNINSSRVEANDEVLITTQSGGHTGITNSVIGKNGGMKSVIPPGWHIDQPSGWVQGYDSQGNFIIGTIGKPSGSFSIGHDGTPTGDFKIVQEKPKDQK